MIKKVFVQIALLTFLICLMGCLETPVTIPEFQVQDTERVVLVEYLTGVKCPNCPKSTTLLKGIKNQFPKNIAIVSIHGRFLTEPLSNSKFDFRNEFSRQLEESYRPFIGKPAAMINRVKFPDEPNLAADFPDLWPAYITDEISKAPRLTIVSDYIFDKEKRTIDLKVGALAAEDLAGGYKISVYLSESNIIDPQESVGTVIIDYVHDHVLRHMMTAWDGDNLGQNFKKGDLINRSFSYTVPPSFNINNLEIVIAVSAQSNREVLQAHKIEL